ncbi:MAG: AAA family ATPase [Candidatus Omnitrophica bacterium]|nr:AAA family ATPase [Candidatus Omnitrophota bacterium]MCB9747129.1 AAA family ATPase [Candidatus Omnitrophota bacterium]
MKKKKELKNIFLSSIHQDAGKTTMSLGLFKALKDRRLRTSFMKPIGQQFVNVNNLTIDKDSYLIGQVFQKGKTIKEMSPITIGRGYTEKYIFNPHKDKLSATIVKSFKSLTKSKDAIIVEGTGHAGVGAVIDYSNADVAALLGSKTIIISGGGIGRSIDEIVLNKALFDLKGVEIIGVIVNKVLPEKYDKIKRVIGQGLKNKGISLLGVIPVQPLLSAPTIEQVKQRLNLQILCGENSTNRRIKHTIVAAMEPHNMIHYLKDGTLVLTSGDRVDNILVAVSSHLVRDGRSFQVSGIILTGGLMPNPKIVELLKSSQIPVLITEEDTYTVAAKVEHLICKIQKTDKDKIQEATRLVEKHVDVDKILKAFD